ncbi:MAG: cytochrome c oxidase subunit II [Pyrinomonadaceae bacterium]
MELQVPFAPEQASTIASSVDGLYLYLVLLTLVFSTGIAAVLTYFVIRYRRRSPYEVPRPVAGSLKLESLWSIIPFFIGMSIFVWGADVYFKQYRLPRDGMDISVVGKQWMWKFQQPTGQREINELHVPVGRRVKLTMTTEDVIHSFYVPAFRVKMDVVPGTYTHAWFEATKVGRYHLFCTEYCGTNHSGMGGWIEVMEPGDYEAWLSGGANQESPITSGEKLFQANGCVSCHQAQVATAVARGPSLIGLFGSQVKLEGGSSVTADEEYIRESILNPRAKLVAGYLPIMPTFQGQLTEEQVLQLIAYIKSLNPQQSDGIQTTAPVRQNNPQTGPPSPAAQGAASPDAMRSNPLAGTSPRGNQQGGAAAGAGGNPSGSSGVNSQRTNQATPRSN